MPRSRPHSTCESSPSGLHKQRARTLPYQISAGLGIVKYWEARRDAEVRKNSSSLQLICSRITDVAQLLTCLNMP